MSDQSKPAPKRPSSYDECYEALVASEAKVERLKAELDWFRRQMFGQKSEKMPVSDAEQADVFAEDKDSAAEPETDTPQETLMVAAHTRHKHGRRDLSVCDGLPIGERIVHDVSADQKICECCGNEKKRLPSKFSYQVAITRPKMFRVEHETRQYLCGECCEVHAVSASKPTELLERCMADASLLAHVAMSKYADHIPLHRQEVILRRMGIDLSRWTMCNWMTNMGEQLWPLVNAMLHEIQGSRHAHVDETTVPMLAPGKTKTSYMWSVVGGADAPYSVYRFTQGRGRAGPLEFLKNFGGVLQSDAYVVYEKLSKELQLTWAACWAHVRRKFVDAVKLCACSHSKDAIERIRELYQIERVAKSLSDEQRCAMRREKAAPVIDRFFQWLDELQWKVLPQSPIGKAVAYALNLRSQLRVYLDHGYVGIDNNPVERALRPVVVGRKNWLFTGNEAGAKAAAVFYSLIESAKRHGLNVADYLEDVIRRLPSHNSKRIRELLPDQWQPLQTPAKG